MKDYDFLYMLNGSWDIWEEETCHHVEKGQLLILEPGLHHYSLQKCSPNMRNMYIHCTALPDDGIEQSDALVLNKVTDCSKNIEIEQLFLQITLKLNLAHEQLRLYPGRGLRDIAISLGFYDEFHFSRLFKRQFGYPPSYRR